MSIHLRLVMSTSLSTLLYLYFYYSKTQHKFIMIYVQNLQILWLSIAIKLIYLPQTRGTTKEGNWCSTTLLILYILREISIVL